MSTTIIFILGALSGSVVTFAFLSILVRNVNRDAKSKLIDYNERSLEALQERNRISREHLEEIRLARNSTAHQQLEKRKGGEA
jgi:hypothetical protein